MEKHRLIRQFLKGCFRCKIYYFIFIILSLCVYGTYGIQISQRAQYKQGFNLLINKRFPEGWKEIRGALAKNPWHKYTKLLIGSIKNKSGEIKKERPILQEIFFYINGKSSALINSKVVFEGDSIGEIKIIKVNIDSVEIAINGKKENIKFNRTGSFYNKDPVKVIKDGQIDRHKEEKQPSGETYTDLKHYEKVINYYKEALSSREADLSKEFSE